MNKWISLVGILLICTGLVYVGASLFGIQHQKHVQGESMAAAQKAVSAGASGPSGDRQNGEAIGILRIPALDREVPIVTGADEDDLEKGVGHVPSTALPGEGERIFLAGHRDTVFTQMGELKPGDVLEIHMAEGTFTYEMTDSLIVDQDDLSVMDPAGEEVLTLSTCYPFEYLSSTDQRYIIHARPVH
ncbi:class D sortase [Rossellomorea marisflavi]|uniref:class D sortase n=1 Tax=Rossellomorea marisflavi TaxID=189381 RepID=UPI0013166D15|nr:class D sortase [Rossellomorea marisflavi]QHA37965.1 class D sortase [Rossellomorea marisflavi]